MTPTKHSAAGELLEAARRCTRLALFSGALEPLATETVLVGHGTERFSVHLLDEATDRKWARRTEKGLEGNPFLPYDERMLVAELSETHVCLLNRFPVFEHHLLLVTREWEDQSSLLTEADFEAIWRGLQQIEGLGFYNAGSEAGASQRHKHLQLIPFVDVGEDAFPWVPELRAASREAAETVAGFDFPHVVADVSSFAPEGAAAGLLLALYLDLRRRVGLAEERAAYNLLLTREFMFLVPRCEKSFEGVEINSLGFAGSLLLRWSEQLDLVRRVGLPRVLAAVAPREITPTSERQPLQGGRERR